MKTATLTTATIVGIIVAVHAFIHQFNRELEAAYALPMYDETPKPAPFRRLPLPLELIYVTIGMTATIASTIRKALA